MRTRLSAIAVSATLFIGTPFANAATVQPSAINMQGDDLTFGYVKPEGGYTNIRKTPGGAVAMKLKDGTPIYYGPGEGNWFTVYNTDYNFLGYIHYSKVVDNIGPTYTYGHIKREGGFTNIRKSPNGAIAMKLKDGTNIYYISTSSDWWKVYDTKKSFLGYVHRSKIVKN